ncbi:protein kinase [Streptomyces sp. NPDC127190]|uniref:serine/threonine-protein kinase n=1 Tax=unclassified Streptomyces TaxID=2593676 RepID=UPI0036446B7C
MSLRMEEPRSVGGYRIVDRLGSGGMGVVYRARARSGREVAVKIVHAQYAEDPVFRARFRQEIAAVRKVSGAFTAPVVDADPEAVRPWMATQYVPARSLAEWIEQVGPLRAAELRGLALGLVEALRDIHRAGVVHRDLKPGNVLMAEDGPRVIDFGISRAAGDRTLTETGHMIGTPPFMSPEQLTDARTVGPASDVFSLGALLVYAATGRGPFDTDSPYLTAYRVVHEEPDLEPLTPALRAILTRCLAKDAADRPGLDALAEDFATGLPAPAPGDLPTVTLRRPDPEPTRPTASGRRTGVRRHRARLLALAGASGVLGIALTAYLLLGPPQGGSTTGAGGTVGATEARRWAPVPAGWRPWRTTVFANAAHGVTKAPHGSGDGSLSCAQESGSLYCAGDQVLPVRLDALTGKVLWRADDGPGTGAIRYENYVLGVHDGVVLLRRTRFLDMGGDSVPSVVALDAGTGKVLWSRPMTDRMADMPALVAGLALAPDESAGHAFVAYSLHGGGRRWSMPLPADHSCDVYDPDGGLYAVCSRFTGARPGARLLSVDPADGTTRTLAVLPTRTTYLGALGGRLVFAQQSGTGSQGPDDTAYGHAILVDRETGAQRTVALAGAPKGEVTLVGGMLCFTVSNGLVTAHSPETGKRLWRTRTTLEQPGRPVADGPDGTVFLASVSGRAAALDARRGHRLWESYPLAGGAQSGYPALAFLDRGALLVTAPDGTVFSLDPAHPERTPASA